MVDISHVMNKVFIEENILSPREPRSSKFQLSPNVMLCQKQTFNTTVNKGDVPVRLLAPCIRFTR